MNFVLSQVSEGLDFADRAGRAVIVTGMPFSTPTDPKVFFVLFLPYISFFFGRDSHPYPSLVRWDYKWNSVLLKKHDMLLPHYLLCVLLLSHNLVFSFPNDNSLAANRFW